MLVNPHCIDRFSKNVRIITFKYFDELKFKILKELSNNKYDVIIHSAAVSDYKLKKTFQGKIPSRKKEWVLKLIPAPKLIKIIRKLARFSFLVQFKLEMDSDRLIDKAFRSLEENKSDLVVANALEDIKLGYKAYVVDKDKKVKKVFSKKELFCCLLKSIPSSK